MFWLLTTAAAPAADVVLGNACPAGVTIHVVQGPPPSTDAPLVVRDDSGAELVRLTAGAAQAIHQVANGPCEWTVQAGPAVGQVVPAPTTPEANVGAACRTDGDCIGPDTVCRKSTGAAVAGTVGASKLVRGTCTVPGAPCHENADCGEPFGVCRYDACLGNE